MPTLTQRLWDARRFGVSPAKLVERLSYRDRPKVLCVSIPKSGTHLLESALCEVPGLYRKILPTLHRGNVASYGGMRAVLDGLRGGEVLVSHLTYSDELSTLLSERDIKTVFMIRDPRDVVISHASSKARGPKHPQYALFRACADERARIELAVRGNPGTELPSLRQRLRDFEGWLGAGAFTIRFEELVGPRGGGSGEGQAALLGSLLEYLGIALTKSQLERIQSRVFSERSPTFNKGAAGAWRQGLDAELLRTIDEAAGEEIARLGYER